MMPFIILNDPNILFSVPHTQAFISTNKEGEKKPKRYIFLNLKKWFFVLVAKNAVMELIRHGSSVYFLSSDLCSCLVMKKNL